MSAEPPTEHAPDYVVSDLPGARRRAGRRGTRWLLAGLTAAVAIVSLLFVTLARFSWLHHTVTASTDWSLSVTANVSRADVVINGVDYRNHALPAEFRLQPMRDTVKISVPFFADQSCTIYPATQQSFCSFVPVDFSIPNHHAAVTFLFSTFSLAPAIAPLIQHLIAQQVGTLCPGTFATVPIGDYYAVSSDGQNDVTAARATAPVSASLTFSGAFGGVDIGAPLHTTGIVWFFDIEVDAQWTFRDAHGVLLGEVASEGASLIPVQYQIATVGSSPEVNLVGMPTLSRGDLTCSQEIGQPAFTQAERMLATTLRFIVSTSGGDQFGNNSFTLQLEQSTGATQATGQQPRFIDRFGVLLAANAAAHDLLPALPVAPADEIATVLGTA